MSNYENLTSEEFDSILVDLVNADNPKASQLFTIPGVYELVSEAYNNAVLDRYELNQQLEAGEEDDDA